MSEPVLPTIVGTKAWLIGLPIFVSIIAFWLGLLAIPLRAGREVRDIIYRILACAVSSYVVGIPALLAIKRYMPFVFDDMAALAVHAQLEPFTGFLVLVGCVMLICSVPGPWIVGAIFLYIEKRKDTPIDELIQEYKQKQSKD